MTYKFDGVVSFSCNVYKKQVVVEVFADPAYDDLYERLNVCVLVVEPFNK